MVAGLHYSSEYKKMIPECCLLGISTMLTWELIIFPSKTCYTEDTNLSLGDFTNGYCCNVSCYG